MHVAIHARWVHHYGLQLVWIESSLLASTTCPIRPSFEPACLVHLALSSFSLALDNIIALAFHFDASRKTRSLNYSIEGISGIRATSLAGTANIPTTSDLGVRVLPNLPS